MFYKMYLQSVCERRDWGGPTYNVFPAKKDGQSGYFCVVNVNNREYNSVHVYKSEELAKDAAATQAYMICRNFSANDGMMPGKRIAISGDQGAILPIGYNSSSSKKTTYPGDSPTSINSVISVDSAGSSASSSPQTYYTASVGSGTAIVCACQRSYTTSGFVCELCFQEASSKATSHSSSHKHRSSHRSHHRR